MPRNKPSKQFTVVADTREKLMWGFTQSKCITDIVVQKMDTGDYSIQGYEKEFVIERKCTTSEIALNVLEPRWKNVLARLAAIPQSYIICEFTLENVLEYPLNSGIPLNKQQFIKLSPEFLLSCLTKIQVTYGIPVIFAGNRWCAERIAESLMKRIIND